MLAQTWQSMLGAYLLLILSGPCADTKVIVAHTGASADAALSEQGGLRRALLAGLTAATQPQICNGRTLWLIIGLLTMSSPLAILLTQARGGTIIMIR